MRLLPGSADSGRLNIAAKQRYRQWFDLSAINKSWRLPDREPAAGEPERHGDCCSYQGLMEQFSLTQEELSLKVGKSRSHIANFCGCFLYLKSEGQCFTWNIIHGTCPGDRWN